MSETIRLKAADGHELDAYVAQPAGQAKGAIVVLQEIFGVNAHIRSVCDKFAADGYVAIAPALFDRFKPGFESGYSPDEVQAALGHMKQLDWNALVADTKAAFEEARRRQDHVSIVGFCLGGSLAFYAATAFDGLDSAVCYYGGRIKDHLDRTPKCPVLMHFGETDRSIPLSDVELVRAARPDAEIHLYPAGHGFNRGAEGTPDAEQAKIAWQRTLAFIEKASRHG